MARSREALTPEAREDMIIAKAYDLAEKRIEEGIATSQEIVHFLKMGSARERQERRILAEQEKMLNAKTDAIKSAKRTEEMYTEALSAMKSYQGIPEEDDNSVYIYNE